MANEVRIQLSMAEILTNDIALSYFQEYCYRKDTDQAVSFWLAVEEYREEESEVELLKQAEEIFEIYLRPHAEALVEVNAELVSKIEERIQKGVVNPFIFNDAQADVLERYIMKDITSGFSSSEEYRLLLAELMARLHGKANLKRDLRVVRNVHIKHHMPLIRLKYLLNNPIGAQALRTYLQSKGSAAALDFFFSVRSFKHRPLSASERRRDARYIFDRYMVPTSPHCIVFDDVIQSELLEQIERPTPYMFDQIRSILFNRLQRDVYPRFVNSTTYQATYRAIASTAELRSAYEVMLDERSERISLEMEYLTLLKKGDMFIKYGRHAKPHWKFVWVTEDGKLFWAEPTCTLDSGSGPTPRFMYLSDVKSLVLGRDSEVFDAVSPIVKEDACLSIVGSERTLDLQCISAHVRDEWFDALSFMIERLQSQLESEETGTTTTMGAAAGEGAGNDMVSFYLFPEDMDGEVFAFDVANLDNSDDEWEDIHNSTTNDGAEAASTTPNERSGGTDPDNTTALPPNGQSRQLRNYSLTVTSLDNLSDRDMWDGYSDISDSEDAQGEFSDSMSDYSFASSGEEAYSDTTATGPFPDLDNGSYTATDNDDSRIVRVDEDADEPNISIPSFVSVADADNNADQDKNREGNARRGRDAEAEADEIQKLLRDGADDDTAPVVLPDRADNSMLDVSADTILADTDVDEQKTPLTPVATIHITDFSAADTAYQAQQKKIESNSVVPMSEQSSPVHGNGNHSIRLMMSAPTSPHHNHLSSGGYGESMESITLADSVSFANSKSVSRSGASPVMPGGADFLPVVKEGFLYKRTQGKMKRWQRRYFMIRPESLCYYRGATGMANAVSFPFKSMRRVVSHTKDRERRVFNVELKSGRTLSLMADTAEICQEWAMAISSALLHTIPMMNVEFPLMTPAVGPRHLPVVQHAADIPQPIMLKDLKHSRQSHSASDLEKHVHQLPSHVPFTTAGRVLQTQTLDDREQGVVGGPVKLSPLRREFLGLAVNGVNAAEHTELFSNLVLPLSRTDENILKFVLETLLKPHQVFHDTLDSEVIDDGSRRRVSMSGKSCTVTNCTAMREADSSHCHKHAAFQRDHVEKAERRRRVMSMELDSVVVSDRDMQLLRRAVFSWCLEPGTTDAIKLAAQASSTIASLAIRILYIISHVKEPGHKCINKLFYSSSFTLRRELSASGSFTHNVAGHKEIQRIRRTSQKFLSVVGLSPLVGQATLEPPQKEDDDEDEKEDEHTRDIFHYSDNAEDESEVQSDNQKKWAQVLSKKSGSKKKNRRVAEYDCPACQSSMMHYCDDIAALAARDHFTHDIALTLLRMLIKPVDEWYFMNLEVNAFNQPVVNPGMWKPYFGCMYKSSSSMRRDALEEAIGTMVQNMRNRDDLIRQSGWASFIIPPLRDLPLVSTEHTANELVVYQYAMNIYVLLLSRSFMATSRFFEIAADVIRVFHTSFPRHLADQHYVRILLRSLLSDITAKRKIIPQFAQNKTPWLNMIEFLRLIKLFLFASPHHNPSNKSGPNTPRASRKMGSRLPSPRFGDACEFGLHVTETNQVADSDLVIKTIAMLKAFGVRQDMSQYFENHPQLDADARQMWTSLRDEFCFFSDTSILLVAIDIADLINIDTSFTNAVAENWIALPVTDTKGRFTLLQRVSKIAQDQQQHMSTFISSHPRSPSQEAFTKSSSFVGTNVPDLVRRYSSHSSLIAGETGEQSEDESHDILASTQPGSSPSSRHRRAITDIDDVLGQKISLTICMNTELYEEIQKLSISSRNSPRDGEERKVAIAAGESAQKETFLTIEGCLLGWTLSELLLNLSRQHSLRRTIINTHLLLLNGVPLLCERSIHSYPIDDHATLTLVKRHTLTQRSVSERRIDSPVGSPQAHLDRC